MDKTVKEISEALSQNEILCQLAEECSELAQAALKMVRSNNGKAYKSREKCIDNLAEELEDVKICIDVLECKGVLSKQDQYREAKVTRWHRREVE